ncbi:MAG TPA: DUF4010 domain-containing protein [Gemmatimonadaceae bacterium]|nr:DUF4010 domain-containing protein [Gemmatimonadaceae bacterium]
MTSTLVIRLAIASLVGLAVGIEREWSGHGAGGTHPRFAGVRTFFLMGAIGGTAGWLLSAGSPAMAVTLVAGASLLVAVAYWQAARAGGREAIDGTTEMAALLVLALGVLAGFGELDVAGGAGALLVLALSEKATIHGAVARLDSTEFRAAMQFAVLALIVLPVLPDEAYGPLGGVNPRELWIVVLIFSGLNFAGFIARRVVGASRGYGVTGALGGVISSTAVTLQFSRLSRVRPDLGEALAIGVVAASTVLLPRVLVLSLVLAPSVAMALLPYLAPPFVAGLLVTGTLLLRDRRAPKDGADEGDERSPLRLWSAIKMAVAFQAALMAIAFVRTSFGSPGVLVSAALLGLTDMDALTLSMNRMGRAPEFVPLAAQAIAVGVSANAVLKLTMAMALGAGHYRLRSALGLVALLGVGVAAIVVLAR